MKDINKIVKYRSRKHCILLYPDDANYNTYMDNLKSYEFAYIIHDKDKNDIGELKKQHTHVVLTSKNAVWNSALSVELGIPINYIQQCRNEESALNYLVHFNDCDKYQYSIDEVKGSVNIKNKLIKYINNDDRIEEDKMLELLSYIDSYQGYLTIKKFSYYCCEKGMWSDFRRNSHIILNLISEHNSQIKKD